MRQQSDVEELTAWLDGELDAPAAERVERLVAADPDWRATCEEFRAVEAAMRLLPDPRPRRDLTDRIVRAARHRRRAIRAAGVLVPLAAAAGVLLAVLLAWPSKPPPAPAPVGLEQLIANTLQDIPAEDRFVVQNLSLFQHYNEVADYQQVREVVDAETMAALASLESTEGVR